MEQTDIQKLESPVAEVKMIADALQPLFTSRRIL